MKMKKILSAVLTAVMLLSLLSVGVFASAEPQNEVYVTIADGSGKLVLACEKIAVTDIDEDGNLTVNDVLYCAHEAKYNGGASAGYASANGDYGLSLTKLWGVENGGSYGYYLNDTSCFSLADTVKSGDRITAFIYTDTTAWSDKYCYFNESVKSVTAGDEISLTLSCLGYDESWNTVVLPVKGATVTVDGSATEYKTDDEGKVTIKLDKAGNFVISATSDSQTLVPPACVVNVAKAPTNHTALVIIIAVCVAAVAACAAVVVVKRKKA